MTVLTVLRQVCILVLPFNNYFLLLSPLSSSRRITCTKTKARNRLQLSLLEAIIRIRVELLSSNKCYKEFVPSTKMLNRFKADIIYSKKSSIESVNNEEDKLFEKVFM